MLDALRLETRVKRVPRGRFIGIEKRALATGFVMKDIA
jgi:hypothetical protein